MAVFVSWGSSGWLGPVRYLEGGFSSNIAEQRAPAQPAPSVPCGLPEPQCLFCFMGELVFVPLSLCLVTACESFLPSHSCLKLFKYLEIVHFAGAWISFQASVLLFLCCGLEWLCLAASRTRDLLLLSDPLYFQCYLTDICGWPIAELPTIGVVSFLGWKIVSVDKVKNICIFFHTAKHRTLCSPVQGSEKRQVRAVGCSPPAPSALRNISWTSEVAGPLLAL